MTDRPGDRLYVKLKRERIAARVVGDALRSLHFGWISLHAEGDTMDCDGSTAALLVQISMRSFMVSAPNY